MLTLQYYIIVFTYHFHSPQIEAVILLYSYLYVFIYDLTDIIFEIKWHIINIYNIGVTSKKKPPPSV